MTSGSLSEVLIEFVSSELLGGRGGVELGAEDDLLGSGLIDSLSAMRLVRFVEERFGVSIPPDDITIENFMTVQRIVAYLGSMGVADGAAHGA